jgi:hypothetical protein
VCCETAGKTMRTTGIILPIKGKHTRAVYDCIKTPGKLSKCEQMTGSYPAIGRRPCFVTERAGSQAPHTSMCTCSLVHRVKHFYREQKKKRRRERVPEVPVNRYSQVRHKTTTRVRHFRSAGKNERTHVISHSQSLAAWSTWGRK